VANKHVLLAYRAGTGARTHPPERSRVALYHAESPRHPSRASDARYMAMALISVSAAPEQALDAVLGGVRPRTSSSFVVSASRVEGLASPPIDMSD